MNDNHNENGRKKTAQTVSANSNEPPRRKRPTTHSTSNRKAHAVKSGASSSTASKARSNQEKLRTKASTSHTASSNSASSKRIGTQEKNNTASANRRPSSGMPKRQPAKTGGAISDKRNNYALAAAGEIKQNNPKTNHKKRKKKNPKLVMAKKIISGFISTIVSIMMIGVITVTICCTVLTVWVLEFMEDTDSVTIADIEAQYNTHVYATDPDTGELVVVHQVNSSVQRIPVDITELPQHVCDAFVYVEDERFYAHDGVDYKRTFSSFMNLFLHFYEDQPGGSTITQQLIKNITKDDDPSIDRKIREIFRAMQFEKKYTKQDILEGYMNYIEFGGGAAGIEVASLKYFGKSASELSIAEAACLAAIPKSPETLNPFADFEANKERKEYVLLKMYENGAISYDEYIAAINERLILTNSEEYQLLHPETDIDETIESQTVMPWYVDAAIYEVADYLMDEYGITQLEAIERINTEGYQIYTTVDLNMQAYVEEKFKYQENFSTVLSENGESLQSSFIAMDYFGNILAVVGGVGDKPGDLVLNRPVQSKRDPGSTIKPISTYGKALQDNVINWSTPFIDQPITVFGEKWPQNYSNTWSYDQYLTVNALKKSINTVPAQLLERIGLNEVFQFATENMGLDLVEYTDSGATDIAYSPLAVGGLTEGVTLENLVNAYLPYGNGGMYYEAHVVSRVEKNGGETLVYTNNGDEHRAVDEDTAYIMNKLLQEVVKSGTGTAAALSNKTVAGKTGTSQNWNDLSFIGLTPDFVSGIWLGYDTPSSLQYLSLSSAGMWNDVIGDYANGIVSDKQYPVCDTVVELRYCTATGLLANSSCTSTAIGYYKQSAIPEKCTHSSVPTETAVETSVDAALPPEQEDPNQ